MAKNCGTILNETKYHRFHKVRRKHKVELHEKNKAEEKYE